MFYDLHPGDSDYRYNHTQIVTRVTHRAIWVAQHSKAYNKPLRSVLDSLREPTVVYTFVHPVATKANIYQDLIS